MTNKTPSPTTPPPPPLSYRLAKGNVDLDILRQFRRECGWGMAKLEDNWGSPDRQMCVFTAPVGEHGEMEDVGMGGWVFEMPDDPEVASRASHTVQLVQLFIRKKYQGLGFGKTAMNMMERIAVDLYHAQHITLDTASYFTYRDPTDSYYIEDFSRRGRTCFWYEEQGYTAIRDPKPMFGGHPTPEDPNRKLWGTVFRKPAALVLATTAPAKET